MGKQKAIHPSQEPKEKTTAWYFIDGTPCHAKASLCISRQHQGKCCCANICTTFHGLLALTNWWRRAGPPKHIERSNDNQTIPRGITPPTLLTFRWGNVESTNGMCTCSVSLCLGQTTFRSTTRTQPPTRRYPHKQRAPLRFPRPSKSISFSRSPRAYVFGLYSNTLEAKKATDDRPPGVLVVASSAPSLRTRPIFEPGRAWPASLGVRRSKTAALQLR